MQRDARVPKYAANMAAVPKAHEPLRASTTMNPSEALAWLERNGSRRVVDGMARYGISTSDRVVGVSMGQMLSLAKRIGKDHELAVALWKSGVYEARMLATLVDDPKLVTLKQMDSWVADFDNWAICDTACFGFYDRSPHAWRMVDVWATRKPEFEKRTAFALLASLALHDKQAPDARFTRGLRHIARAATDDRNFVKKGVSWALRGIGHRNAKLHAAAVNVATRLSKSSSSSARWSANDARFADLLRPMVTRRFKGAGHRGSTSDRSAAGNSCSAENDLRRAGLHVE
jgi:3-methyladenine DNA glycosylase AlkD